MDVASLRILATIRTAVSRRTKSSLAPAAATAEDTGRAHLGLTYDPALDAVRGISMIAVLAGHVGFLGGAARVGMPLFFALSGFLITRLLVTELDTTGRPAARPLLPAAHQAAGARTPVHARGCRP